MARREKMDEAMLRAIVREEKTQAMGDSTGTGSDTLSAQRARNMDYYLGDMDDMPVPEGRSTAVSTDVADTVEGIMPDLLDIFMGSEEVCRFNPVNEKDAEAAKQETDYTNHIFWVDNPGFITLTSMMKDALIQKNGIVKYWWEEGEKEERETYRSLTPDAYAAIVADKSVEVIEHTERDILGGPAGYDADIGLAYSVANDMVPTLKVHDLVVIKRKPYGCVKVMAVPPEEFLIARDARNIRDSRYCAHRVTRTQSELIEDGYDKATVETLPTGSEVPSIEQTARATVGDDDELVSQVNRSMRPIEVTEHFIRVDWDGDGIAELRKVTTAGSSEVLLDNEPYDRMPFAGLTPILMPHRFWGRALADLVIDIQRINTALTRSILDNAYYANNQRIEISEAHAGDYTIDDLLTNRPGGIIRTKSPGGLMPIPNQSIAGDLLPVLEHMQIRAENRTGVQRNSPGAEADVINPFKSTATGVNAILTEKQKRVRMIARTFAETGVKDLMLGIHETVLKHGKDAREVELNGKWVTVDPRNWKTRKEMTITVGLGTGSRDQIQAHLMMLYQIQMQDIAVQGGPMIPGVKPGIVSVQNAYNLRRKLTENAGFRSADPFFTAPTPQDEELLRQIASNPPPNPEMAKVEAQAKAKEAETQAKIQGKQQELAMDYENEQKKMALEAQNARQQQMLDMAMERFQAMMEQQLKKYQVDQDMRLEVYRANLEAQVAVRIGAMQAASNERVASVQPGGEVG
jgi:hypothetical protein